MRLSAMSATLLQQMTRATKQAAVQDGCAVETEPLARIVSRFVANWEKTRPTRGGGQFNGPDRSQVERPITMSAIDWLSAETGLPVTALKPLARVPKPSVAKKQRKKRMTELRVADLIVSALDMPEAYHDGTLEIKENPRAPKALRASCCGGSS